MFRLRRLALSLATLAPVVASQQNDSTQAALQARYDSKLAAPFVAKTDWTRDLDAARKAASDGGKRIFAYFTRSYAA